MDREARVRAYRRRQVNEALAFERERAADLEEEIDQLVATVDGSSVDERAFARMPPEDADLARSLLRPAEEAPEEAEEDQWLIFGDDAPEPEEETNPRAEAEEEIARLEEELAESRRRQQALERYLEALDWSDPEGV